MREYMFKVEMINYVVLTRHVVLLCSYYYCTLSHEFTVATYNVWNVMFNWEVRQLRISQMVIACL